MRNFLRFWWKYLWCSIPLVRDAFKRGDLIASALTYFSGLTGLTWLLQYIPWYVPVAGLALLFVYGVARGVYDDFEEVRGDKDTLEKRLEEKEKRIALNDMLGTWHESGKYLQKHLHSEQDRQIWVEDVYNLIEAAFGKARAQRFLSNEGYTKQGVHPKANIRRLDTWLDARLWQLEELIGQIDSLTVRPDFDPQDWATQEANAGSTPNS